MIFLTINQFDSSAYCRLVKSTLMLSAANGQRPVCLIEIWRQANFTWRELNCGTGPCCWSDWSDTLLKIFMKLLRTTISRHTTCILQETRDSKSGERGEHAHAISLPMLCYFLVCVCAQNVHWCLFLAPAVPKQFGQLTQLCLVSGD